jgi:hypothetical protein
LNRFRKPAAFICDKRLKIALHFNSFWMPLQFEVDRSGTRIFRDFMSGGLNVLPRAQRGANMHAAMVRGAPPCPA